MEKLILKTNKKVYNLNSIFPFGTHAGEQLKRIPITYYEWVIQKDWFRLNYNNLAYWVEEWLEVMDNIKENKL